MAFGLIFMKALQPNLIFHLIEKAFDLANEHALKSWGVKAKKKNWGVSDKIGFNCISMQKGGGNFDRGVETLIPSLC